MKYFLIFSFIVVASLACNSSKNATSSKEVSYWKQLEKDKIPDAELQETGEILQDLVLLANNPQLVSTRNSGARKIALPR